MFSPIWQSCAEFFKALDFSSVLAKVFRIFPNSRKMVQICLRFDVIRLAFWQSYIALFKTLEKRSVAIDGFLRIFKAIWRSSMKVFKAFDSWFSAPGGLRDLSFVVKLLRALQKSREMFQRCRRIDAICLGSCENSSSLSKARKKCFIDIKGSFCFLKRAGNTL